MAEWTAETVTSTYGPLQPVVIVKRDHDLQSAIRPETVAPTVGALLAWLRTNDPDTHAALVAAAAEEGGCGC